MKHQPNPPSQALIHATLDGTITADQLSELEHWLRTDPSVRIEYLRAVNLHAALDDLAQRANDFSLESRDLRPRFGSRWAIAAGLLLALVGSWLGVRSAGDRPIAHLTGLGGSVRWTGNGGRVTTNLRVGDPLTGGTIEGATPASWVEVRFVDGSTVTIAGNSMLTIADLGQKILDLKGGGVFGDVNPQPDGKPMLVQTRSARLEVVGTRFAVDSSPGSTVVNVTEGKVRVQRLSDGRVVEVAAAHRLSTAGTLGLAPTLIPDAVAAWRSRLDLGPDPDDAAGDWSPATATSAATLRSVPYQFTTSAGETMTLYSAALKVSRGDTAPVALAPGSRIEFKGRLGSPHDVVLGVTLRHPGGGLAGNYLTILPARRFAAGGAFDLTIPIADLTLDPASKPGDSGLATSPAGQVVEFCWSNTLVDPAGLAIDSVAIIPPATPDRPELMTVGDSPQ